MVNLNEHQIANRRQWVKNLLSGEYKQGINAFKRVTENGKVTYCCLGVACEGVNPNDPQLHLKNTYGISAGIIMTDEMAYVDFGLDRRDQSAAMEWNDSRRYSFARIADFVAYATISGLRFEDVPEAVPVGFAQGWLAGTNS